MLLVPLTGKGSWKNPPIVTIVLILINCCIFFFFQFNDNKNQYNAEKFYFESGLVKIELSKYLEYRHKNSPGHPSLLNTNQLSDEQLRELRQRMSRDTAFLEELQLGKIILPHDPKYEEWKQLRRKYDEMRSWVTSQAYGFIPAAPSVSTIFSYMFLHGSLGHLLGNMVFLWLSGCMLEMGSGRKLFCFTYVFTGLFSVMLFWAFNPSSNVPLVGASGAISGLMGAFSVLYGWKKIDIFYSLGFYFNYVKVPAILLLPLWIGNEFFQLFFSRNVQIAYIAHLGGLLSGAALSLLNLKWIGAVEWKTVEKVPEDPVSPLIERALAHVERLEINRGARLLEEALILDPDNKSILNHLYNARKMDPQRPEFHDIAQRLLSCLLRQGENKNSILKIYLEYKKLVNQTQLSTDVYLKLSALFMNLGQLKPAEGILALLLKNKPGAAGLSTAVLKLANGYKNSDKMARYQKCLKIISSRFPASPEARMVKTMFYNNPEDDK